MSRAYVFSLIMLFLLGSSGMALAAPPAASTPTAAAGNAKQPPAAEPARKESTKPSEAKPAALQEHVVYVPFSDLRKVFEREDSSIVLPYAQFLEMWQRLRRPEQQPIRPPLGAIVTRADYVGVVKGELAHLDATLDVESLTDQWAQLPVQFGDAAIGSAQSPDEAVLLRGVGQGQYELLVRSKGKHQVKLHLVTGVKSAADGRSFTVQCPAVGVSNLEIEIPEKDLAVHVAPQRTSELLPEAKGVTRLRAVLGSTGQFTVRWQPKSGSFDKAAGLANVTDTIAVDVGDGVVHTHAVFDYQILRGSLSELVFEAPAGERLLDVQTRGLRDWQSETVGGRQRVKVRLHAPATETARLEVHTESPIPDQAFEVGRMRTVGVARESGILAVRSAEGIGLEHVARESITRIDAATAPPSLRAAGGAFYKFFTPDHKLRLAASQLKPRIVVESRLSVMIEQARLATRGEFTYHVSRSGLFALTYRLPAGFQVDEVRTESMERFEVTPGAGVQTLTVYFTKKLLGDLAVCITASEPRDKPAAELSLPLIEPVGVTREEALVAVIAPESLEVKTDAGRLHGARAATPAELAAKGFQPQTPGGSTLAAAFSFLTRPVTIVQTVARRPRQLFAFVGTAANVREDVVQVATTFRYQIQFAGTDTFRIAAPAAIADRLQIDGEGIKERRRSPQPGKDGMVEWTIVLHGEAFGRRTFTATYDRKLSASASGDELRLQPIRALDVDRETGEIAIHKDRALSVDVKSVGLEEIDPRELSQPLGASQPYLTYRYYRQPAQLTLRVTKHELQEVVKTVVRRAYIEAVATEDGPMTIRARYDLKSSERQRLALTLRNPRILGVTVAGQTVAPEKAPAASGSNPEDKTYFINVARATDSDEPFQIAVVFETPRPEKTLKITDFLSVPLPQFDEDVKLQKVYVRVWTPKDYRLVGEPAGFVSHIGVNLWSSRAITEARDSPDSWFPKDSSSFDFQVGGTPYLFSTLTGRPQFRIGYWHIPTMTTIGSLLALGIGVALVRFSLDRKVLILLVLALAILFVSLFLPSPVYSWLLAARPGIAGVLAIWLIVWLLYVRRTGSVFGKA
ncbi:MAG: hypothetical protein ABFC96_10770, partial [Thermoguttaceae bacterium]